MYEELYETLPDVGLYWARLGMEPPVGAPSRELLDSIVQAHQRRIPFENLDICDGHRVPSLGIRDLFNKIIAGQRGGFCFELNALFSELLASAGFNAQPCIARSLKDYGYVQPIMHRGTIVTVNDQRLYCDVGYGGPMPACCIPLKDGARVESCGQVFLLKDCGDTWWHIFYCGSAAKSAAEPAVEPVPVLAFQDSPMNPVDFVPLSHFCATHPNSVFTQRRMVNRRTENGNVSITADQFTQVTPEGKATTTIESDEEFRSLLKEYFGIVLPEELA